VEENDRLLGGRRGLFAIGDGFFIGKCDGMNLEERFVLLHIFESFEKEFEKFIKKICQNFEFFFRGKIKKKG